MKVDQGPRFSAVWSYGVIVLAPGERSGMCCNPLRIIVEHRKAFIELVSYRFRTMKVQTDHVRDMVWVMRIYAAIIIAVLLLVELTSWLADETGKLIIMIMALLLLAMSFQPYLADNKKARKWLTGALVALFVLGIVALYVSSL